MASINTPFLRDGSIDSDGVRSFIDVTVAAGTGTLLLTPGDSLYNVLTDEEIAELTKIAAERVNRRAMMEIMGICGRWRRDPLPDFTDQDVERLRGLLKERSIL